MSRLTAPRRLPRIDTGSLKAMASLWQNVGQVLRALTQSRGLTTVVILIVVLGIGRTTTIFGVTDSVLLNRFSYKNAADMLAITSILLPDHNNLARSRVSAFLDRGSGEGLMLLTQWRWLFLLPIAAAAGVVLLAWWTRRLSLKAQFLTLLIMGVSISFVLLMIVQLPGYRPWLEALLVLIVFVASPIAVRIFLRALAKEEDEEAEEIHKPKS